MIFDFHTHTFLSDGVNLPIELIRCALEAGYGCIALTDHASAGNIDTILDSVRKDCKLAQKYWNIMAIPGVELTHVPAESINELAQYAKDKGAGIVNVHGETIAETVQPGTNLAAINSKYVDMLAHPGLLTLEEAILAAKNETYIEITHRTGHSLSNGRVADIGKKAGVSFLINSDAHSHYDLYREGRQKIIGLGAGFTEEETDIILNTNTKNFLKKLGY
jgi:histidinol phosphatase-like PHP family hydrolase